MKQDQSFVVGGSATGYDPSMAFVYATPRISAGTPQITSGTLISPVKTNRPDKVRRKTLRRLRGFLAAQPAGLEARVVFIVDGAEVEYFIPSKYLKQNGITEIAQPFEMDEFEEVRNGKLTIGTEFNPIAPAKSAHWVTVDLDEDGVALRDAILKRPQP